MNDFNIPIHIAERHGLRRTAEAIRIGVPLPRGLVHAPSEVIAVDSAGGVVPHQASPLAFWSDRSVKWLLVDALLSVEVNERTSLFLRPKTAVANHEPYGARLRITARDGVVEIDTGPARFEVRDGHPGPLASATVGTVSVLDNSGSAIRLIGQDGKVYTGVAEASLVEEQGPVRAIVVSEGWFHGDRGPLPLRFLWRSVFVVGSSAVSVDVQIQNTRAAHHPGGLWDLGDPGSWFFKDLTLFLRPRSPGQFLRWYSETPTDEREHRGGSWSIYQDSSGGDNWDSPNHFDRNATSTVTFRGYRVTPGPSDNGTLIAQGARATPGVTVVGADAWIAAGTRDFWQNFPKALRWTDGGLSIGLFPGEARGCFELQGGEQKRHTVLLNFGLPAEQPSIARLQRPVAVSVDPAWVQASRAITWFVTGSDDEDDRYSTYVQQIIEGPRSFVARREVIDEYGWRNFGELYADHEAVHHQGPQPFVSHYNNQYDFVYGAFVHFQRTGDTRWQELMRDAARHVIDIDIYHTQDDKAAFNGGLFWHTDHYLPAATCTHRGYSRCNRGTGDYGGGPSNEQNYTSGLLHYYYVSGDFEAAKAVHELADYVLGMDDGSQTLFCVVDDGPTGAASKTLESSYHNPGRGAGNSINALLDAYALSRDRRYFAKADELIQRCIHPLDDIAQLRLDDPEHRWSYLVFLQVLGKYLEVKRELGEIDYGFHYARESLLHYAEWIAENEVPFKEVLHKVEIPTETWPAHDIRKCHVLHVAADYSSEPRRSRFKERAAFFFDRCLTDLAEFSTAHLTRPLVILCVYGSIHGYFCKYGAAASEYGRHNYAFGLRPSFVPQRARVRASLTSKIRVLVKEVGRLYRNLVVPKIFRVRRSG